MRGYGSRWRWEDGSRTFNWINAEMEYWSIEIINTLNITPFTQHSNTPSFWTTGGAACCSTAATGWGCGALELSPAGESKSWHHPVDLFAFTLGTYDLFRRIEDQFFKFMLTLTAMIFIDGHLRHSFPEGKNQRITRTRTNYANNTDFSNEYSCHSLSFVTFVIVLNHNIFLIWSARNRHLAVVFTSPSSFNSEETLWQTSSAFLK